MSEDQRFKKAEFAAWVGIIGNLILVIVKGSIGLISNSKALIADAVHSASDIAGSFAVLIGLKAAKLPPDKDHPYGHGKAEPIAAIIVSILLILVSIEVGISAVKSIYSGVESAPKFMAIYAIVFSIVVKEAMFQYKYRLGKKLSSQALIANAWEHRSDVFSSLAALIGIGGAVIGGHFEIPWMYYLDPIAGIFVAVLVFIMGYRLIKESIHNTMDHVLHQEDTEDLHKTIESVPGVLAINELRAREHGHYVIVDVKISVNPKISVLDGHKIGKMVKKRLIKQHTNVSDVFVHVNPYDPGYPYKNNVDSDSNGFPSILH
ncbi:cation diffusion facilitator family transporter [Chengkuizengella axinellae]|uniref:Cation diffusion facilitator family transporter n=1 Tax=Chengkuizengella axinellae TaxID=3064388 RepID=A0ABT9ITX6_9BACL|nr:cation diffusion facilitator family transporter [Chengkuizengella sp. 2205SS18-9]MDP5272772.1 cation diffusion facilitator family transporter [Chengkuizengella sp. 2205SS18-9]